MSDIIQKAKDLEAYCLKVNDFDGIREVAQALAEETWEYSYQTLEESKWETTSDYDTGLDEWWPRRTTAAWFMDGAQKNGYVCRLVSRRVSPPEVIDE